MGKKIHNFDFARSCLDLFRARGVTNVERTKLKIKTKIETNNNNLTNCIF